MENANQRLLRNRIQQLNTMIREKIKSIEKTQIIAKTTKIEREQHIPTSILRGGVFREEKKNEKNGINKRNRREKKILREKKREWER